MALDILSYYFFFFFFFLIKTEQETVGNHHIGWDSGGGMLERSENKDCFGLF